MVGQGSRGSMQCCCHSISQWSSDYSALWKHIVCWIWGGRRSVTRRESFGPSSAWVMHSLYEHSRSSSFHSPFYQFVDSLSETFSTLISYPYSLSLSLISFSLLFSLSHPLILSFVSLFFQPDVKFSHLSHIRLAGVYIPFTPLYESLIQPSGQHIIVCSLSLSLSLSLFLLFIFISSSSQFLSYCYHSLQSALSPFL